MISELKLWHQEKKCHITGQTFFFVVVHYSENVLLMLLFFLFLFFLRYTNESTVNNTSLLINVVYSQVSGLNIYYQKSFLSLIIKPLQSDRG